MNASRRLCSWRASRSAAGTLGALASLLLACGKPEPAAPGPELQAPDPTTAADAGAGAGEGTSGELTTDAASEPQTPTGPKLELEAEFHRTRVGPGRGFWVLGMLHNPHDQAVAAPEARVRLLDVDGELAAEAIGELRLTLGPGETAPVTVLVPAPVEHETLELQARGVAVAEAVAPLGLSLEHEEPLRADLGGWYVVGQVHNTSAVTIVGARLEIQGLDEGGRLLGVDWAVLDDVDGGETIEFDVGGLRYTEAPASFRLTLRPPARE